MGWLSWYFDPYAEPAPRRVWIIDVVLGAMVILFILAIIGLGIWLFRSLPEITAH